MITNANVLAVLEAAAQGRCEVPDEAVSCHRALGRIKEARRSAGVGTASARVATELPITKLLDDLAAGVELSAEYWQMTYDEVLAAEKQKTTAQLLDAAEGQAQRIVTSTVESHVGDTIESLAPRLLTLVDETRAVVAQLGDTPRTESAVMRAADGRVRKAWLALDDQGAKYDALRSLYRTMLAIDGRALGPQLQCFGVVKNVPQHWDDWTTTSPEAVPWPTSPGLLLLWSVDHGAELWLPTPEQLEKAVQKAAAARREARYADITAGGSS